MKRVKEFGKKVWNLLSEDEQEAYSYTEGTFQFVDLICSILHINLTTLTLSQIDDIHDYIIYGGIR